MILGLHSIKTVLAKTNGRCSICGKSENLVCIDFIPQWTRVVSDVDNVIPLCDECRLSRNLDFIELGKLKFLPAFHILSLMKFYDNNSKYVKAYVRKFGGYRTRGLVDIDYALTVLTSYDQYIADNEERLEQLRMR